MANLTETAQWEPGIYQIETSDPVLGGPDGISNKQAKLLANRTSYLKQQTEAGAQGLADHVAAADPHPQYAPEASPVFTGKPVAPTAAQASNDTQLATTAFVKAALAALVASSPAALDTLNELAAALGNDANFAATMTTALAGKQPKDAMLTNLSGKDVAGLLQYLGLGTAATENSDSFISSAGGDYSAELRLKGVGTLPGAGNTAANTSELYSADGGVAAFAIAAGGLAKWYTSSVLWGLVRDASTGSAGYGVDINGVRRFSVDVSGNAYANGNILATESHVQQAVSALVNSSPAALDTLKELADALGNDANFAATITHALAGKQPLDTTLNNLSGKDVAGLLRYLGLDYGIGYENTWSLGYYAKIPFNQGGVIKTKIVQFGKTSVTGGQDAVISMPIPFPSGNTGYNAMVCSADYAPGSGNIFTVAGGVNSQGNLVFRSANTTVVFWICIGE